MNSPPLVLFDGPCTLCQRSIRFILRNEKEAVLRFASLQSESGKVALAKCAVPEDSDAMVLIQEDSVWVGSEAALNLCGYLTYPWRLLYPLRHLPTWLHQPVYKFIARHRYRWFGKDESCPLPDPEQAERFLD
jgi:predicted DCC family thiol-disulfide oxidoreductase YuxK